MTLIVQKDNKVLRDIAKPVNITDITSPKIQKIIADMKEAMGSEHDAVAIAAPQIGVSLRIFVMSGRARLIVKKEEGNQETDERSDKLSPLYADEVFINPVITKISKKKKAMEEGCLSVRFLYGKVERAVKASVEAFDENGNKFTKGGSGLIAQIFQHETDHLNGALFIDKAKDVTELSAKERETWAKQNRKIK
ncbi:MAG: peptide deformylase [Candidatus Taylorbacteria bacterium RIFCSPLOWO2_02_FULL_43_11]|uniref:Peptide deformylase n=1 Tax=Candidatus Taylorbacteria bacterium RIFCSPHIGHO2_02_FULL_43_32b TaxID=1802306 RepID=A0A1G2MKI9_9BACT|nr:MAG: peptide deformylase [Candidatus Taylorbacteria bacterium RIFCSPHIGHO2_01_FULL_43_47]OHA23531.1 MAG: peptide deformylase [Candidatus Taylorbacteria bacterium RIFCSPHIGHO2_02_FULL_43_32b]OHA30533.1 MAG: peptide deformylase [Candidatus Taylorbacteria bacterium RIFCSPLOWO2_01_FULL_43_44]OHA37094.1 MAG: peptide deformylase [Candidatus Taylorbacteria bacterium RIFCSPLOWO2_02_FULL_43_11]